MLLNVLSGSVADIEMHIVSLKGATLLMVDVATRIIMSSTVCAHEVRSRNREGGQDIGGLCTVVA